LDAREKRTVEEKGKQGEEEGKRSRRYERERGNDDEEEGEGRTEMKRKGQLISVTGRLVL
jgi:hypothetical protein